MAAIVMKMMSLFLILFLSAVIADDHNHVVGGDLGWDITADLASWSAARTFTVGDKIWFTYSRAQGKIAELKTKEEYESCDISNPIRTYTDGLNIVKLEKKGIRYFASSESKNCNNGLKLHVEVSSPRTSDEMNVLKSETSTVDATAGGPIPSIGAQIEISFLPLLIVGLWMGRVLSYA